MIVGIDPGKKAPAHVAISQLGGTSSKSLLHQSSPFDDSWSYNWDAAIVEGQFANRQASRQSLMTLSFHAGMQIGAYMIRGVPCYSVQPEAWKNYLLKGGSGMPKTVFQNRIRDQIPDCIWRLGPDFTDAYCIAVAGGEMLAKRSKKLKRLEWHK